MCPNLAGAAAAQITALFKKAAAPAPAKSKKTAPAKKASSGTSGGWLGSDSKNINLDNW